MQFILTPNVPYPMGLERETAEMAKTLRMKYDAFFRWVQAGEVSPVPETDLPELLEPAAEPVDATKQLGDKKLHTGIRGQNDDFNHGAEANDDTDATWLLDSWDIEYFYGLSRPEGVTCACPFGWVEKVKRIIDQQYPIFGVERFPDLFAKGAHMAWLLLKNQVFPEYNGGIAALSILVLLKLNGYNLEPTDEELIRFIATVRKFIRVVSERDEEEDAAIGQLAGMIRAWQA